jgi:hypothetical protein
LFWLSFPLKSEEEEEEEVATKNKSALLIQNALKTNIAATSAELKMMT